MSDVFKYIFVLIAGIIILVFFVSFAFKQTILFESVTATEVRETLNDYFNALSGADNLVTSAKINSNAIMNSPSCGNMQVSMKNGKSNVADYSNIIFSPRALNKDISIWTRKWFYPFGVANFFYLKDKDTKIFLIGSSKIVNELAGVKKPDGNGYEATENIDSRFNVEKKTSVSADFIKEQARSYKNVIFVFFDQELMAADLKNVDVSSIKSEKCEAEEDDENCRGYVKFRDKEMFFAGKAMLYGAIFAADSQNYECGFNAAVKRLGIVSNVYDKKRLMLSRLKPECGKYNFNMGIDASSLNAMHNGMKGLIESNNALAGGECAKLF